MGGSCGRAIFFFVGRWDVSLSEYCCLEARVSGLSFLTCWDGLWRFWSLCCDSSDLLTQKKKLKDKPSSVRVEVLSAAPKGFLLFVVLGSGDRTWKFLCSCLPQGWVFSHEFILGLVQVSFGVTRGVCRTKGYCFS